jgi:CPA2 family monovalent cation:H+ antiporter-2
LAATVQILATILFFLIFLPFFGFDFYSAIFIGSAFSLSSTAVVVKILQDRGELESLPGGLTLEWLLLQDIATIPVFIILPALAANLKLDVGFSQSLLVLAGAIFKAVALLILVVYLAKRTFGWIFEKILHVKSRELLVLAVFSFCLVFSFGMSSFGFPLAVGAFLAGFIISEIGIAHLVFAEIRPLRDIFAVIFFVSLGFLVYPQFLLANFINIISLGLLVVIFKFFLVLFLLLYLGYHSKTALVSALSLTSVGEFAALLGRVGAQENLISPKTNLLIISVILLTLILAPGLIGLAPFLYRGLKNLSQRWLLLDAAFAKFDRRPPPEQLPLENHVVICGFGRVGKYIGRALEMAKIPFVVVDFNYDLIKELKEKGLIVVSGDPAELEILDYAQIKKARALIIAIPDRQTQEMIITNAQSLQPGIRILCRTHHEEDQARLRALKVATIVQPEFEAALAIINKILSDFGFDSEEIDGKIQRLKIEHGMT